MFSSLLHKSNKIYDLYYLQSSRLSNTVWYVRGICLKWEDNICYENNVVKVPCFQGSVLNGRGYIITITVFSILYNLVKFFEFETVTEYVEDEVSGKM